MDDKGASTQWARVCVEWRVEGPNIESPRSCKREETKKNKECKINPPREGDVLGFGSVEREKV